MEVDEKGKHLTLLLKEGDEHAFEEIYLSFYVSVRYFINQYVQNLAISEDLAQETFYYLWKNRAKIEPEKGHRAYLLAIARSRSLNYLRGERYGKEYMGTIVDYDRAMTCEDSIFDQILYKDLLNKVNAEINRLPEKQREVMVLSRRKYFTNKEIAQKLQINIKTVEYRLMIALKQIRKKIDNF